MPGIWVWGGDATDDKLRLGALVLLVCVGGGLLIVKHNQSGLLSEPCCPAAPLIYTSTKEGWPLFYCFLKLGQEAVIHPITRCGGLNLPPHHQPILSTSAPPKPRLDNSNSKRLNRKQADLNRHFSTQSKDYLKISDCLSNKSVLQFLQKVRR